MSLVVDKITCVEDAVGLGSDEIYFVVFQGRTVAPFSTGINSVGPGSAWSDIAEGDTVSKDVRVASTNADAVYAVMMVEMDDGKDIQGSDVLGMWNSTCALTWTSIMLSHAQAGIAPGSETAKAAGFAGIRHTMNGMASLYMEFPKGNDDLISIKRVTIKAIGETQTLTFVSPPSEDAIYSVRFKHTTDA